ncbi:SDR family oxidoreductase [Rurimicrobium arvi]|uniref:SDR family oxidoreductase n=1 Tax=Rurimicrobium arvi TaxID=2049916 RepID=A0ABP8MXI7_9BACT
MNNILVAGAGKGIGLSVVQRLQATANVYALSRTVTDELRAANATVLEGTMPDNAGVLDQLPDVLHGAVYCPGSINLKPFNRLSNEDFLNDFRQNVLGAVTLLQRVQSRLKAANGASVVLFSTVAAAVGMPFHASIAASKSALEGLAKSLAAEWASAQIRVNVIAPSLTDTPLAAALLNTPEKREASAKRHPLQRIGDPAEVAEAVAFLLGNGSAFMTGQVLGMDGGMARLKV